VNELIFNHIIPRIRVFESRLLDQARFERMIHASSAGEALDILLRDPEYAFFADQMNRPEDYETLLHLELQRVYNLFYEITPVKEVVDIMTLKYDYHNLKVLVKAKILEKDFSHLLTPIGTVELDLLQNALKTETYDDLRLIMREAVEEVFSDFEKTEDPQRIGILFDRYMFEEMTEIAKNMNNTFLTRYVQAKIDLANLETLLRVRQKQKGREFLETVILGGGSIDKDKFFDLLTTPIENLPKQFAATDYDKLLKVAIEDFLKTKSLKLFDKLMANYLMDMAKDEKIVSFGLESVIGYLYAKEMEITSIRIIMVGKFNNISTEAIVERLRDTYE